MTPQEFKAWFEGFTEAFSGMPTKAQWARIKERVAEIDGKPVTERVFVDRYYPTYPPIYWRQPSSYPWTVYCSNLTDGAAISQNSLSTTSEWKMPATASFNSMDAMAALGRADAQALNGA